LYGSIVLASDCKRKHKAATVTINVVARRVIVTVTEIETENGVLTVTVTELIGVFV